MSLFGNNKKDKGESSSSPVVSEKTKGSVSFLKKSVNKIGDVLHKKFGSTKHTTDAEPMSNTEYLGEIYKLMTENRDDIKSERQQQVNHREEEDSEEQKRHSEIIKALTIRRKPKPKRVVRREKKAEEKAKKKEEPAKKEEPPKKQETPKKEEAPKKQEQPKKEEPPKREEAPKKQEQPKKEEAPKKQEQPKKEEPPKKQEQPKKEEPPKKASEEKTKKETAEKLKKEEQERLKKEAADKAKADKLKEQKQKETATQQPPAQAPSAPTAPAVSTAVKVAVTAAGVFATADAFSKTMMPYAEKASKALGGKIPPVAILGQWAGESSSGKSVSAPFNYAGIKAGKGDKKGEYVLTEERYTDAQIKKATESGETLHKVLGPTDKIKKKGKEVTIDEWFGKGSIDKAAAEGKKWVQVKSYFAKFDNFDEFTNRYVKLLSGDRYKQARESTDPGKFGLEVAKAGYATQSADKYSQHIAQYAKEHNTGNQIDQSSKDNKDMKMQDKSAPVNIQQSTTNVSNTSESSTPPKVDDRPAHKRK